MSGEAADAMAALAGRRRATLAISRGVLRLFAELGIAAIVELPLANGRRVDVIGLARDGGFHVVEIKSSLSDLTADRKWTSYLEFAEHFYFAVAADFPLAAVPAEEGLILADQFGGEIVRPARHRRLPPARRKALTLRFARAAAARLASPLIGDTDGGPPQLE